MSYLAEQIQNGLSLGTIYALIALGFAMVYSILRFLNFAHSEVFTAGAYIGCFTLGWVLPQGGALVSVATAMVAAALGAGLLAVVIERLAYRPLRGRPRIAALLTAIGVSLLLQTLGINLFSAQTRGYPAVDLPVTPRQFAVMVLAVSYLALWAFIYRTAAGVRIRAVAESPQVAELMGVDPNTTIVLTFFVGGLFAGVAGVTWGLVYGTVAPQMGFCPGLKAFVITVIGGVGSLHGTFLAAIGLGLVEALIASYLPPELSAYRDAVAFVLLLFVLVGKPSGLLGTPEVEKV